MRRMDNVDPIARVNHRCHRCCHRCCLRCHRCCLRCFSFFPKSRVLFRIPRLNLVLMGRRPPAIRRSNLLPMCFGVTAMGLVDRDEIPEAVQAFDRANLVWMGKAIATIRFSMPRQPRLSGLVNLGCRHKKLFLFRRGESSMSMPNEAVGVLIVGATGVIAADDFRRPETQGLEKQLAHQVPLGNDRP